MEPIAQSPAVHRPVSDSIYYSEKNVNSTNRVDSGTSLAECSNSPVCHKVVTEATVEVNMRREEPDSPRQIDPSRLCLDIEQFSDSIKREKNATEHLGTDSTYASSSTEQTIERLFTPHEPKRVTFDLYDSQEKNKISREESEDSMYNSGESFVPTYPEYSTQQEYGTHCYMYPPCSYTSYSPVPSPSIEHSISDIQLFKTVDKTADECIQEQQNINKLQDAVHDEPITTSSPRRPLHKNITVNVDVLAPHSPKKIYREPPTESSL